MSAQFTNLGKGALRVAKNYTRGYSEVQTKVRDATSNDAWGPSGTQMNEIAQMTYSQNEFVEIMEMLDKRLNDKGKNWRHVFKALTVLDYCLHAGSENVVIYFKDNVYIVKTLKEFVYVDEDGKDVGANVRQKAKDITNLLQDDERLRNERRSRGAMRDRMLGNIADSGLKGEYAESSPPPRKSYDAPSQPRPTGRSRDEDDDLKRAIEASKRESMNDDDRRRARNQEEDDLARAIRLSEEEDARRKREQDEANAKALFDESQDLQQQPQQQLVDFGWQQPMQPQYTSFNPFLQQQMYQQQQEEYMRQQMMLAEQQRQQEEWMRMQQQQAMVQQQQALQAQPTGYRSNNPFGPGGSQQQSIIPAQPYQPPQPQAQPLVSFQPDPTPPSPQPQPVQQQAAQPSPLKSAMKKPKDDGQHSGLAALLANRGDGLDTFGNVGAMRVPVNLSTNRTGVAGGGFVPTQGFAPQQTGNGGYNGNPFMRAQQTGQQQQQQHQNGQNGQNGNGENAFFTI